MTLLRHHGERYEPPHDLGIAGIEYRRWLADRIERAEEGAQVFDDTTDLQLKGAAARRG